MKRVQERISGSRFALQIMMFIALAVVVAGELWRNENWLNVAIIIMSTLCMVKLNNDNAMIRIYSRMVSCSFLALCISTGSLAFKASISGAQLCFILFFLSLFRSYQDKQSPGIMFYTYAILGIASVFYVQILFFVPLLWLLSATKLQAGSLRNWIASVLGLMMPYWFVFGYFVFKRETNALDATINHITEIADFQPIFDYSGITVQQTLNLGFIVLLALIGTVHFLRNSYKDKIRTRMIFESFIIINFFALAFIILQPVNLEFLSGIMIVCTSTLIGHFIALTHTKFTNITFFIIIAAALVLAALNIWMPLSIFL